MPEEYLNNNGLPFVPKGSLERHARGGVALPYGETK